ncbi:MAG: helix-turn-helix transcriptional regulator [Patescibacteria group bacterium]|jgi:transcriptional regulator with XRE-family HTH domain
MINKQTPEQFIGSRIKAAREKKRFSQLDLAKLLGFQSATAISLIEAGERGVPAIILEKLGKVLDRDIMYFLGKENTTPDIKVALRADKDLSDEDKDALNLFIDLAKNRKKRK